MSLLTAVNWIKYLEKVCRSLDQRQTGTLRCLGLRTNVSKLLYRKYHVDLLANWSDQQVVARTLRQASEQDKISHAYLFRVLVEWKPVWPRSLLGYELSIQVWGPLTAISESSTNGKECQSIRHPTEAAL